MSFFFEVVIKNIIGIYCSRSPFGLFIWSPNRSMFTLISDISGVFRNLIADINFERRRVGIGRYFFIIQTKEMYNYSRFISFGLIFNGFCMIYYFLH